MNLKDFTILNDGFFINKFNLDLILN